jgi:queuine/archaeosine tRNA-ribosyltransferase
MDKFEFKILKKSRKSKARLSILTTPHGQIETPAFVTVGTKGTVKSLTPEDLDEVRAQMIFINTYHTVLSPGVDIVKKAGGIHKLTGIKQPIITDSGGFQVFSLTRKTTQKRNITQNSAKIFNDDNQTEPLLLKISDDGVEFRSPIDGRKLFFTPEFSIEAQKKIGGDLMVAFDECTYYGAPYKYTKKAMERTHQWAERSLKQYVGAVHEPLEKRANRDSPLQKNFINIPNMLLNGFQRLYGVIQGGLFKDLRRESAKFISSLPFFGLAIGGVSVGETKKEMREQVSWVVDVIGNDKRPIHLLGVGEIDDIFDAVKMGIDTMDCVVPTRHARMGKLYRKVQSSKFKVQNYQEIDIFKSVYKGDLSPIDINCQCYTCKHLTRAYLHHLFKQRELLAYRLATIHNLYFFERLFKNIRKLIENDKF